MPSQLARVVYLSPVASHNGDGSTYSPYNNLSDAIAKIKTYKGGTIAIYDGTLNFAAEDYVIDGTLSPTTSAAITIQAFNSGKVIFTNFSSIAVVNCALKFQGINFEPRGFSSAAIYLHETNNVSFVSCSFDVFNSHASYFPSSLISIREAQGILIDNCRFDLNGLAADSTLDTVIELDAGGELTFQYNYVVNIPQRITFIQQTNSATNLLCYKNNFNGRITGTDNTHAVIHLRAALDSSPLSSTVIRDNIFKDLDQAILVWSNQGYQFNSLSMDTDRILVVSNLFRNCFAAFSASTASKVYFYLNTVHGCRVSVGVDTGADAQVINSIFTSSSVKTLAGTGNIEASYSDFFGNIDNDNIFSSENIVKGAFIRFIDPFYTSTDLDNFELDQSSDLLQAGIDNGLPFTPAHPNMGNTITKKVLKLTEEQPILIDQKAQDLRALPAASIDTAVYMTERIKEQIPEISLDPGNAVSDLLLKPSGVMIEGLQRRIDDLSNIMTLQNARTMADGDLNRLLANYFVYRKKGGTSKGTVRLYLYAPVSITVPAVTYFYTADDKEYKTLIEFSYTPHEVLQNVTPEGYYYVDVAVESSVMSPDVNINSGEIVKTSYNQDLNRLVKITNPFPISGGYAAESNMDYLSRARRSISSRGLSNLSSIEALLLDSFPEIKGIDVVGFGDPEMRRNIHPITGEFQGNMADVYVSAQHLFEANTEFQVPPLGQYQAVDINTANIPVTPVLYVKSLEIINGPGGDVIQTLYPSDAIVYCQNPELRFSGLEVLRAEFLTPDFANAFVRMNYVGVTLVKRVNGFLMHPMNRPVCYSLMAKHYTPVLLDLDITHSSSVSNDDIQKFVEAYISVHPAGMPFDVSTLLSAFQQFGIYNINLPVYVTGRYYNRENTIFIVRNGTTKMPCARLEKYLPGTINVRYIRKG